MSLNEEKILTEENENNKLNEELISLLKIVNLNLRLNKYKSLNLESELKIKNNKKEKDKLDGIQITLESLELSVDDLNILNLLNKKVLELEKKVKLIDENLKTKKENLNDEIDDIYNTIEFIENEEENPSLSFLKESIKKIESEEIIKSTEKEDLSKIPEQEKTERIKEDLLIKEINEVSVGYFHTALPMKNNHKFQTIENRFQMGHNSINDVLEKNNVAEGVAIKALEENIYQEEEVKFGFLGMGKKIIKKNIGTKSINFCDFTDSKFDDEKSFSFEYGFDLPYNSDYKYHVPDGRSGQILYCSIILPEKIINEIEEIFNDKNDFTFIRKLVEENIKYIFEKNKLEIDFDKTWNALGTPGDENRLKPPYELLDDEVQKKGKNYIFERI